MKKTHCDTRKHHAKVYSTWRRSPAPGPTRGQRPSPHCAVRASADLVWDLRYFPSETPGQFCSVKVGTHRRAVDCSGNLALDKANFTTALLGPPPSQSSPGRDLLTDSCFFAPSCPPGKIGACPCRPASCFLTFACFDAMSCAYPRG